MADEAPALISRKAAEIGFALVTAGLGIVIIIGALEHEIGWTSSGPEAGYFPFRIGLVLLGASSIIVLRELFVASAPSGLLSREDARGIAVFAVPFVALLIATPYIGIYIAAALYLLVTVGLVGRAGWAMAFGVALLFPAAFFVMFEYVFRVPLPKGPLGPLFGLL